MPSIPPRKARQASYDVEFTLNAPSIPTYAADFLNALSLPAMSEWSLGTFFMKWRVFARRSPALSSFMREPGSEER